MATVMYFLTRYSKQVSKSAGERTNRVLKSRGTKLLQCSCSGWPTGNGEKRAKAKHVAWPSCAWLLLGFFPYPVDHPEHEHCTSLYISEFPFKYMVTLTQRLRRKFVDVFREVSGDFRRATRCWRQPLKKCSMNFPRGLY